MVGKNRSNELKIFRIYDAPVGGVRDASTDPEQVASPEKGPGPSIRTRLNSKHPTILSEDQREQ